MLIKKDDTENGVVIRHNSPAELVESFVNPRRPPTKIPQKTSNVVIDRL